MNFHFHRFHPSTQSAIRNPQSNGCSVLCGMRKIHIHHICNLFQYALSITNNKIRKPAVLILFHFRKIKGKLCDPFGSEIGRMKKEKKNIIKNEIISLNVKSVVTFNSRCMWIWDPGVCVHCSNLTELHFMWMKRL